MTTTVQFQVRKWSDGNIGRLLGDLASLAHANIDQLLVHEVIIPRVYLVYQARLPVTASECTMVTGRQIAEGLAYLHSRGLVHLRLRPSVILAAGVGNVCIGECGHLQLREASFYEQRFEHLIRDGIAYRAPETIKASLWIREPDETLCELDDEPGPASDVYSFGVLVAELVGKLDPGFTPKNMCGCVRKVCTY